MPSQTERKIFMYNDDFNKLPNDNTSETSDNSGLNQNTTDTENMSAPEQATSATPKETDEYSSFSAQNQPCADSYNYSDYKDQNSSDNLNSTNRFSDGVPYKSSTDGKIGYEWNPQKSTSNKKRHNSDNPKRKISGFKVFTTSLLTVFVLSFAALTVMVAGYISNDNEKPVSQVGSSVSASSATTGTSSYAAVTTQSTTNGTLTIPQIAAKCSPSAVGIVVEVESTSSYNFGFGFSIPQTGVAKAIGSGFILNSDGYIITNHHLIDDATKITVVLHDKTELEATLVGSDSISDIAVIKVEPTDEITLVPMEIGNSDELVVGEEVVAIGCPAGIEYMGTVTNGIISAINRDVEITDNYGRIQKTMTLIQTNATINKGNSGGPLINSKGQVIGINTLKLTSQYEGIGFSIPMNGAMAIINQLINYGEVIERTEEDFAYGSGVIGISGSSVTKEEAEQYGIPQGVLVFQIDKNSSAAKAGLRRGDIITAYNGTEVKTVEEINTLKAKNRAGEQVTVTVYRDGETSENGESQGTTFDITFKLDAQS